MARNQSSQTPSSRSSCDRIRKATFGRFRPSFSSKPRVSFSQPMALQQPFSGKEIPIEYVPSPEVKSVKNVHFSGGNVEIHSNGGKKLGEEQKTFGEAKFDSFIGRMKMKMSAPSDVGDAKMVARDDSFNDKVSTFIGRARLKLRATSSMGANGKTVSFK